MSVTRLFSWPLAILLSNFAWGSGHSQTSAPQTFTGEIMDSICVGYKGHARMMREMKSMGTNKDSCIEKCLQLGGKYALYNATSGTVYPIANPEKARAFGGQVVEVSGTLDKKKLTITEIQPLASGADAARVRTSN